MTVDDRQVLERWRTTYADLKEEWSKAIAGREEVLEQLLVAVLARGHCLIEGVAGSAKARLPETLARCMSLDFRRLTLTSETLPAEIAGFEQTVEESGGRRADALARGPLFAHMVLAEGIQRTTARTQALLMEAMRDRSIEVHSTRYELPNPFVLIATHNHSEPDVPQTLSASDLDRFLLKIVLRYPSYADEYRIAAATEPDLVHLNTVSSAMELLALQSLVHRVIPSPPVVHYVLRLVRTTRVHEGEEHDFVLEWVSWGAGTRGVQALMEAAKARAVLQGRMTVTAEDVRAVVHPVLRHRLVANLNAVRTGVSADRVIDKLVDETPERADGDEVPAGGPLLGTKSIVHSA